MGKKFSEKLIRKTKFEKIGYYGLVLLVCPTLNQIKQHVVHELQCV